jgi:glutamate carboxypeptidase
MWPMTALQTALAAAARRGQELLPMLERWVRENSFSGNVAGVNAVADHLTADLALPELALERHRGDGVGDHLVWRTPAWEARPDQRLVLVGHHDTVFPPGTFEVWERDGDRLRGPGVLDMKGGLAAVRTALAALSDAGALAELPLALVSVGDEEIGSPHSRDLLEQVGRGARGALVFEAGRAGDAIITRRKGTGKLEVSVRGRAAHAGNHHPDGINAIWALARFIDAVSALTDYDRGVTVNVGTVRGGSSANTVPAEAVCAVDFRFIRAEDGHELVARADRLAREIGEASGATMSLTGGVRRQPLEPSEAQMELFRRYAACARAAGLGDGECALLGGGSDASTLSAVGVPAIDGLGPRGKGFHTHDEFIEVSSLPLRVEALVRFLIDWMNPTA